jgi:hypothetical protein
MAIVPMDPPTRAVKLLANWSWVTAPKGMSPGTAPVRAQALAKLGSWLKTKTTATQPQSAPSSVLIEPATSDSTPTRAQMPMIEPTMSTKLVMLTRFSSVSSGRSTPALAAHCSRRVFSSSLSWWTALITVGSRPAGCRQRRTASMVGPSRPRWAASDVRSEPTTRAQVARAPARSRSRRLAGAPDDAFRKSVRPTESPSPRTRVRGLIPPWDTSARRSSSMVDKAASRAASERSSASRSAKRRPAGGSVTSNASRPGPPMPEATMVGAATPRCPANSAR